MEQYQFTVNSDSSRERLDVFEKIQPLATAQSADDRLAEADPLLRTADVDEKRFHAQEMDRAPPRSARHM